MGDPTEMAGTMDASLIAPPPSFADPARREKLASAFGDVDRIFAAFRERHRIPGVAYGVVVDGELAHAGGVGMRDVAVGAPVDADSVFRIASVTKSLTAACVLLLRDEGRLCLDDPVAGHVPELAELRYPTLDAAPMTVRQLLSMSAGLVTDDAWADRHLDAPHDEFGAWLRAGVVFTHAPGIAFEYSNVGFGVLGRVVANVSGRPARAFADERVLAPLRMSSTTWDAEAIPNDRIARGYRLEDDAWVTEAPLADGALGAMGGLATSVRDYARYVGLHLSAWPPRDAPDEGPLRRSSLREMQQLWRIGPTFMADGDADEDEEGSDAEPPRAGRWRADGYGYGLTSGLHEAFGRVVAHSGGLPGFGTHVRWLPDHGVGVIGFANLTYARASVPVARALDALARAGGLAPRIPHPSPALAAARDAAVALYRAWDDEAVAALAADNLFLDVSLDRRRRAWEELRARAGACVEVGGERLAGSLRGTWRLGCERGAVDLTVALSPVIPPRVQTLLFERVQDDGVGAGA
jgi:D-alanyl-D-alanine-carboxypeptidase/D-alanyl-D-alanine-endopeptidase